MPDLDIEQYKKKIFGEVGDFLATKIIELEQVIVEYRNFIDSGGKGDQKTPSVGRQRNKLLEQMSVIGDYLTELAKLGESLSEQIISKTKSYIAEIKHLEEVLGKHQALKDFKTLLSTQQRTLREIASKISEKVQRASNRIIRGELELVEYIQLKSSEYQQKKEEALKSRFQTILDSEKK